MCSQLTALPLGARMVETMDKVQPRDRVVGCVKKLAEFLPLYDEAARQTGGCVFRAEVVEAFGRLWEEE